MRYRLGIWLVVGAMAGCAPRPPVVRPVAHRAPAHRAAFNARQAAYILHHGSNTIEGQAIVRYSDGPASCAGDVATLVPDTPYTRARLNRLYGGSRAFAAISTAPRLPRDRNYEAYVRHAPCDADGRFRFDRLADGRYVVVAPLRQAGEARSEGESIRQGVAVRGGKTRSILLTH